MPSRFVLKTVLQEARFAHSAAGIFKLSGFRPVREWREEVTNAH